MVALLDGRIKRVHVQMKNHTKHRRESLTRIGQIDAKFLAAENPSPPHPSMRHQVAAPATRRSTKVNSHPLVGYLSLLFAIILRLEYC